MKFVDEVRIYVKAGDGGNGSVAFRREKFIEKGGPSGGDGGDGASIWFSADPQLTTLLDYRYQQHHRGRNGEHGMGSDCNGRGAEDLELRVPVGTLIKNEETGELLYDLSEPGQRVLVAKGGRGGLGNMNFATSTRQTPRFAQDGTPGEEVTLRLELRLLADVGLIGYPNAGKSTLISVVSRAKPRIADYPFTTLVPNLGMVQYRDAHSFVMADIPGLIEGASDGAGLGLQFLRHVERCRVLVHVVDLGAWEEERSPVEDFDVINRELANYSPELAEKPQVVVASKLDLPHAQEKLPAFVEAMAARGLRVYPISAATHEGLQPLLDAVGQVLFREDDSLLKVEVEDAPVKRSKPVTAAKDEVPRSAKKTAAPKLKTGGKASAAKKASEATAAKAAPKAAENKVASSKPEKKTAAKAAASKPEKKTAAKAAASKPDKKTAAKAAASKPEKKTAAKAAASKPEKKTAAKAAASKPEKKTAAKAAASKPAKKTAAKAAASKPAKKTAAKAAASKPAKKTAATAAASKPAKKTAAKAAASKPAKKSAAKAAASKPEKKVAAKLKATSQKPAASAATKKAKVAKAEAKKPKAAKAKSDEKKSKGTQAKAAGKKSKDLKPKADAKKPKGVKAASKPEKKVAARKSPSKAETKKSASKAKTPVKKSEATRGGKRG